MKTKIKIAVIAVIGMSLGVIAQTNKIEPTGNVGIGITNPTYKVEWYNNTHKGFLDFTFTGVALGSKTGDFSLYSNGIRRFFIGTNGYVGIGTTSPNVKLDVNGIISSRNEIRSISSNPALLLNESDVTDKNWHLQVNGGDLKFYEVNDSRNNWSQKMIIKSGSGNVAIYGKLESKEIKVTNTPTADFVFEENYDLPTLKSIEKYIKEKKHLPEIASAKEMEKNGVNVGNFQIQLLQKIEELTLYTIAQEKEIKELKKTKSEITKQSSKIDKQQKEIEQLKTLVQKLLKDKN